MKLVSVLREEKSVAGVDCVGVAVGNGIIERAMEKLEEEVRPRIVQVMEGHGRAPSTGSAGGEPDAIIDAAFEATLTARALPYPRVVLKIPN